MASLTETAHFSRRFIKIGGIALVVMIVGRFILGLGVKYYQLLNPDPPPPPTVCFGVLPELEFPVSTQPLVEYKLETKTGTLPQFGDRADVFIMPEKAPRFLALDQAIDEVGEFGFKDPPIERSEVLYRWRKEEPLPSTLDMYIYWGKFTLTVDWSNFPDFFDEKELPEEVRAIEEVKSYLSRAGYVPVDLFKGDSKVSYLKASGGGYKETVSLSEADFVQVDAFRQKVSDVYEAVTPDPKQGVVRAIVSGNRQAGRIVQVEYNYYEVDYEAVCTYPLKEPALAWDELKNGKGYVASLNPGVENVTVRRVELGYYDAFDPQDYFQPVYVFRGDDNFIAYVPAIRPPSEAFVEQQEQAELEQEQEQ